MIMLNSMWYSITGVIILATLLWLVGGEISGMAVLSSIGYVLIIAFILFAIIFIIKWSIEKLGRNI